MNLSQISAMVIEEVFGLWRYRWFAVAVAWIIALAGWGWVLALPNQYDATARVYVNTETILRPLLTGLTVPPDTLSEVAVVTQVLLSQPQLRAVAVETGLEMRARTPEDLERLLEGLKRRISIGRQTRQDIYTIEFRDHDREMARNVVQVLLTNFMESSLRNKRTDTTQAQAFLQEQIRLYERRLEEAESRLAEFKKANVGLMPGEGRDYFARLQNAETELQAAQAEVRAVQQRRNELLRQVEGEEPVLGISSMGMASAGGSSVDGPIAELERQLADLRVRFTDRHPDVLRVQQTLDDLYRIRDEERQRQAAQRAPTMALSSNPVYQQMRVALSATEAELASLSSQVGEKQATVSSLRRMMDTIPEVEAQLNRLNRDYDVVKRQYDALVQRLEMGRLSEDLQTDSEQVTFEVIEPPRLPLFPAAPNRPLLFAAVTLVALGLGLAFAWVLNHHNQVFFSVHRLRTLTALPVFGAVSNTRSSGLTGNDLLFGAAASGLLVALAVLYTVGANGLPVWPI